MTAPQPKKKTASWEMRPFTSGGLFWLSIVTIVISLGAGTAWGRTISPLPSSLADLTGYRGQEESVYYFEVTGGVWGSLFGTGVYTDDSHLGTAAVHAGVLAEGETGVVKVTILPGQEGYSGSTANGVTSASYGAWAGSYSVAFDDGGDNPVLPGPETLEDFRFMTGSVYHFLVTGDAGAEGVFGTNVYTDDSTLAAAAVHAGVLADGETGVVKVVMAPGQESYVGCEYNGVQSGSYGSWHGSFAVMGVHAAVGLIPYPGTMDNPYPAPANLVAYRGWNSAVFHFLVTGSTEGSIWGTGIYTDDSRLAKAAVHAGVLTAGESGAVRVTILPGQASYSGSAANGVVSEPYGAYSGSYAVAEPYDDGGGLPWVIHDSATATVGESFSFQITAQQATSYNATGLPAGLTIDTATGLISGIPEISGEFMINLLAVNELGTGAAGLFLDISASSTDTPIEPVPAILVNGIGGALTLASEEPITITVELQTNDRAGDPADWWLVAMVGQQYYSYQVGGIWQPGIRAAHQGLLFDLSPAMEVLALDGLSPGSYTIYFGVDFNPNKMLDFDQFVFDRVDLTVQ